MPLLDRCEVCGEPVNYRKGIYGNLYTLPTGDMMHCRFCKTDLREAKLSRRTAPEDAEINFQVSLERTAQNGWVNIPGSGPIYSHLYFIVLRKLMVLFASGKRAASLRQYVNRLYGNTDFSVSLGNDKNLELLNVSERRGLLGMAREILPDWPYRFIDFCHANKLSRTILFFSMDYIPFWYWKVVRDHLTRNHYSGTQQEIQWALGYLGRAYDQRRLEWSFPENVSSVSRFLNSIPTSTKQKMWKQYGVPDRRFKVNRNSEKLYDNQLNGLDNSPVLQPIPDDLWEEIAPLIPRGYPRKQRVDDRTVMNGVLYVLLTNCTWHAIPARFGTWQQVYCRYQRWKRTPAFEKIWRLCSRWYGFDAINTPSQPVVLNRITID